MEDILGVDTSGYLHINRVGDITHELSLLPFSLGYLVDEGDL